MPSLLYFSDHARHLCNKRGAGLIPVGFAQGFRVAKQQRQHLVALRCPRKNKGQGNHPVGHGLSQRTDVFL